MQYSELSPCVVWFSGLSGSGKTTLANALYQQLKVKFPTQLLTQLDGDVLRNGLNNNLGFSAADRKENIRRAAEVANLFYQNKFIVLASFITPTHEIQELVQTIFKKTNTKLIRVFVDCPLAICEERDVKGLYKKARAGQIADFTGISSPFEPPQAELTIPSHLCTIEEGVTQILNVLLSTARKNKAHL